MPSKVRKTAFGWIWMKKPVTALAKRLDQKTVVSALECVDITGAFQGLSKSKQSCKASRRLLGLIILD